MIRLGISVEGATEREFIHRVLEPHLAHRGVQVKAVVLGGPINLDKIKNELPALFRSFERVSTLYDFYGFERRKGRSVVELEAAIHELAKPEQRRFLIPYVQLHEVEALLFAVPEKTVSWLQGSGQDLTAMRQAVKKAGSPEEVNDSRETSPSHRLKNLFPGYDKKLHGPDIFELAGLSATRLACPRFNAWVTQLEGLAFSCSPGL